MNEDLIKQEFVRENIERDIRAIFEAHYLIVVDRMNNTDTFQIQVEVRQEYYSDEMNKMIALKKKIAARMQSVIGLQPDIKIVEPRSIERSMGKAKHVIDKRKLV